MAGTPRARGDQLPSPNGVKRSNPWVCSWGPALDVWGPRPSLMRGEKGPAWHDAEHAENQRTAQSAVSRHTTEKSRHIRLAVFKSI